MSRFKENCQKGLQHNTNGQTALAILLQTPDIGMHLVVNLLKHIFTAELISLLLGEAPLAAGVGTALLLVAECMCALRLQSLTLGASLLPGLYFPARSIQFISGNIHIPWTVQLKCH